MSELQDIVPKLDREEKIQLNELLTNYNNALDSEDKAEQVNALKQLQGFVIQNENLFDKAKVVYESSTAGINKGLSEIYGFPVDLVNLGLAKGEDWAKPVLNKVGFDFDLSKRYFSTDKPMLGSEGWKQAFGDLGIETEYDKTRALSAIVGRVSEEIGATVPFLGFLSKGVTTVKEGTKAVGGEMFYATTGGLGAASAQQIFPDNLTAELYGQTLGYLTPLGAYKLFGFAINPATTAFNLTFRRDATVTNTARNVLAEVLKAKGDPVKLEAIMEQLKGKKVNVLGEEIDASIFPRLLDEVTADPQMDILKNEILKSPEGAELIKIIEANKYARLVTLENIFLEKMLSGAKGKTLPELVEEQFPIMNTYLNSRLAIAEQNVAEKMTLLGPDVTKEQATSILRRELDGALYDAQQMEKQLWGKVKGKPSPDAQITMTNELKGINEKLIGDGVDKVPNSLGNYKNLYKAESYGDVLDYRNQLLDEIRLEQQSTNPNMTKITALSDAVSAVDNNLFVGLKGEKLDDAINAYTFSKKIRNDYIDSSVGSILGYNINDGRIAVIDDLQFDKLVGKGEQGGIQAGDYTQLIKGESEGIKQGLLNRLNEIGPLNEKTIAKFVSQNKEVLDKFPELKTLLGDTDSLLKEVANIQAEIKVNANTARSNRADLFISEKGETTSRGVIENVFSKTNVDERRDAVNRVLTSLSEDVDGLALAGFQDEMTYYILDNIRTKKIPGPNKAGQFVIDENSLSDFIRKNEDSLTQIYGSEGMNMLNRLQDEVALINKAIKDPSALQKLIPEENTNFFLSSIGRILGSRVANITGGPALVFAGIGGRIAGKLFADKTNSQIKALLAKSFRDPDFAAQLLEPVYQQNLKTKALDLDNFIKDEFGMVPTSGRILETETERIEEDLLSSAQVPVEVPTTAIPGSSISSAQVVAPLPTMGGQPQQTNVARAQQAFPFDPIFAAADGGIADKGIMNTSRGRQMVV
jgi:hypothetical protein